MTGRNQATESDSPDGRRSDSGLLLANSLAAEVKNGWRHSTKPDVATVLANHPELRRYKSVALDLAYEEYRRRLEAGESLDAEEFSRQFPSLQRSLFLLIEVKKLVDQDARYASLQDSVSWPEPGESLLGFSLIGELGRGTFGRVFLASEPALGDRLVAVKFAPHGGEEADILGKLRHPNIVPIYSVGEDDQTGLTAVCMPYLGRATLADVLDEAFLDALPPTRSRTIVKVIQKMCDGQDAVAPASFDRILRRGSYVDGVLHLAAQIADALAYAHSRGICHRDMKPSNVLLSLEGRPLLLDFNLSFDPQVNTSKVGGTLPYMAPEQLRMVAAQELDPGAAADARSDIFSLGVILYELLTGSLPFGAMPWDCPVPEAIGLLLHRQRQGPHPMRDKTKRVDKGLARVIDGCLAFEPAGRPESAAALADVFRRHLSPTRRVKRWSGCHRRLVSLLGAVLLGGVLAGSGFLALRDPYSVRCVKRATEYLAQGENDLAAQSAGKAIDADPEYAEAYFVRGRAYLELGSFVHANEDFGTSLSLSPGPKAAAAQAYCLAKMGYHADAVERYRHALALGDDSPATLNNLGHSLAKSGYGIEAQQHLQDALAADGELAAAHYNLLNLLVRRAVREGSLPEGALARAERAAGVCPPSAKLYCKVATLYALAAGSESKCPPQVWEYLEKAVAEGLDPRSLESDPAFSRLRELPEFKDLLTRQVGPGPAVEPECLADPL